MCLELLVFKNLKESLLMETVLTSGGYGEVKEVAKSQPVPGQVGFAEDVFVICSTNITEQL